MQMVHTHIHTYIHIYNGKTRKQFSLHSIYGIFIDAMLFCFDVTQFSCDMKYIVFTSKTDSEEMPAKNTTIGTQFPFYLGRKVFGRFGFNILYEIYLYKINSISHCCYLSNSYYFRTIKSFVAAKKKNICKCKFK